MENQLSNPHDNAQAQQAPVQLTRNPYEMLAEWEQVKKQKDELALRESVLRRSIVSQLFPDPKEGTNTHVLNEATGYDLKLNHKVDRKIDEGALEALKAEMIARGIPVDTLIKYTPELSIRNYRALTEEQMAFFDQVLTIKDGSPSISIVQRKVKK